MKVKVLLATASAIAALVGVTVVATAAPGLAGAATSAQASAVTPAHTTAVIGGKVVDSMDQRPLGGVEVDVFNDSAGLHASKAIATATTSKDGSFSLPGLAGGTYHLELAKRGYALEVVTGLSIRSNEHVTIARPFGMRTAVITRDLGQEMEIRL